MSKRRHAHSARSLSKPTLTEFLESRILFAFQAQINFQTDDSNTPPGYYRDFGQTFATRPNGLAYGWNAANSANVYNRDNSLSQDQRFDTGARMQASGGANKWEIAVPNGSYQVRVVAGDPNVYTGTYKINVETTLVINGSPSSATRWIDNSAVVTVSDGRMTFTNASGWVDYRICFVDIVDSTRTSSAPAAPTAPRATSSHSDRLDLIWNDAADNETYHKIERSSNSTSGFSQIATTFPGATYFTDVGLSAGTQYFYRIRATNTTGNSSYSPVFSGTTLPIGYGQKPYNATATPWSVGSTSGVTIQAEDFDAGGNGISYQESEATNIGGLYRSGMVDISRYTIMSPHYFVGWTAPGEWLEYSVNVSTSGVYQLNTSVGYASSAGTFHLESGGTNLTGSMQVPNTGAPTAFANVQSGEFNLSAGTHILKVVADSEAVSGWGVGNFNSMTLIRLAAPPAPANLVATVGSSSQIDLTWTDVATDETGYELDLATSSDFTIGLVTETLAANSDSYLATGLTAGTTYYFRVRAKNLAGDSEWATDDATTASSSSTVPPTSLTAYIETEDAIELLWDNAATDEDGYVIERKVGSGAYSLLIALGPDATYWTDCGVSPGITYSYRVKTVEGSSSSIWVNSNAIVLAPKASDFIVSRGSDTRLVVNWSDAAGESGYELSLTNPATALTSTVILASNTTTYTFTGLTAGITYDVSLDVLYPPTSGTGSANRSSSSTRSIVTRPQLEIVAGQSTPVTEGSSFSILLDAGEYEVKKWLVDWGDGVEQVVGGGSTTSATHTYADDGNFDVTVKVADDDGETESEPIQAEIETSEPSLSISGDTTAITDSAYTLFLNATDLGIDRITSWTIDWGDGSTSSAGDDWVTSHIYQSGQQTYTITATGTNSDGTFEAEKSIGVTTTPTVIAPSNVVAVAVTASNIDLEWDDNSDNEQGFLIEYSTDGSNFEEAGSTSANATAFTVEGLSALTQYYFRVSAWRNEEYAPNSTSSPIATPAGDVPSIPTGFSVVTDSAGTTFSYSSAGDKIWIQVRYPMDGDAGPIAWSNLGITSEHPYTPGDSYQSWWPAGTQFRIRAVNLAPANSGAPNDHSEWSSPVTASGAESGPTPLPGVVDSITATLTTAASGYLTWSVPSNYTPTSFHYSDSFGVYAWGGAISFGSITISDGIATRAFAGLEANRDYSFAVRVQRLYWGFQTKVRNSTPSSTANVSTQPIPPTNPLPPGAPNGLVSVAKPDFLGMKLAWLDRSDNETGFIVFRRLSGSPGDSGWSQIASPGANTVIYEDDSVAVDNSYEYRVLAYNGSTADPNSTGAGRSSYSGIAGASITLPSVSIVAQYAASEFGGDWGQFVVTRTSENLSESISGSITAQLTAGSAAPGEDYGVIGDFTIAAGQTQGFLRVSPANDLDIEGAEDVTLQLDAPSDGKWKLDTIFEATLDIAARGMRFIAVGDSRILLFGYHYSIELWEDPRAIGPVLYNEISVEDLIKESPSAHQLDAYELTSRHKSLGSPVYHVYRYDGTNWVLEEVKIAAIYRSGEGTTLYPVSNSFITGLGAVNSKWEAVTGLANSYLYAEHGGGGSNWDGVIHNWKLSQYGIFGNSSNTFIRWVVTNAGLEMDEWDIGGIHPGNDVPTLPSGFYDGVPVANPAMPVKPTSPPF
jgi:hypothetical protein